MLINQRSADIPMLVAGDFNSIPGSAAHSLLVKGRVEPSQLVSLICGQPPARVTGQRDRCVCYPPTSSSHLDCVCVCVAAYCVNHR